MKPQITTLPVYENKIYIRFDVNETWNFQILMLEDGEFKEIPGSKCGSGLIMVATQTMKQFIAQLKQAS